jgi:hypothetical protein
MWGSVVVPAVTIVVTSAILIPPVTVVDMSAIVMVPVAIIAVVSTIVISPVSSKCCCGVAVLPFKSMLKGNAYPRNEKVKNLGWGAACHELGSGVEN